RIQQNPELIAVGHWHNGAKEEGNAAADERRANSGSRHDNDDLVVHLPPRQVEIFGISGITETGVQVGPFRGCRFGQGAESNETLKLVAGGWHSRQASRLLLRYRRAAPI